jgi:hypothetical protein
LLHSRAVLPSAVVGLLVGLLILLCHLAQPCGVERLGNSHARGGCVRRLAETRLGESERSWCCPILAAWYLAEDVRWLTARNYQVFEFDCAQWISESEMFYDIARALVFLRVPEFRRRRWFFSECQNFDALDDDLSDLPIRRGSGMALAFRSFNAYATGPGSAPMASGRNGAEVLLDVMACASRFHLLSEERLMILVQTEDRTEWEHSVASQQLGIVANGLMRKEGQNRTIEPPNFFCCLRPGCRYIALALVGRVLSVIAWFRQLWNTSPHNPQLSICCEAYNCAL